LLLSTTIFTTSVNAENLFSRTKTVAFGWFEKLDEAQMNSYLSSLQQAILYADNGEAVHWSKNKAWGLTRILHTDSNSRGYCRTMYIEINAFKKQKSDVHKYCYVNSTGRWEQDYVRR